MEGVKNNVLSGVSTAFQSVGEFVLEGIRSFFVPDEGFLEEKINIVKEKFGFVDSIKTSWENITSLVINGQEEVPIIEIDLSHAEGKYNYGEKVRVLDMTWYSRYKPVVDAIIIAFSYIGFVFLVIKRLPDIVRGSGAITERFDELDRGARKG